jgi:hypothetical protein
MKNNKTLKKHLKAKHRKSMKGGDGDSIQEKPSWKNLWGLLNIFDKPVNKSKTVDTTDATVVANTNATAAVVDDTNNADDAAVVAADLNRGTEGTQGPEALTGGKRNRKGKSQKKTQKKRLVKN